LRGGRYHELCGRREIGEKCLVKEKIRGGRKIGRVELVVSAKKGGNDLITIKKNLID